MQHVYLVLNPLGYSCKLPWVTQKVTPPNESPQLANLWNDEMMETLQRCRDNFYVFFPKRFFQTKSARK